MLNARYVIWIALIMMAGCASLSISSRLDTAYQLSAQHNWQQSIIQTNKAFDLVAYIPATIVPSDTLIVYIEGDGFAWQNRTQPSQNPTPKNPLALRLALNDKTPQAQAVYLARPCQYIDLNASKTCNVKYWTSHRFAPEVIKSVNAAIDILKVEHNASKLKLVGYSGGGAVAALVAAHRDDVIELVTIAGNLDTEAWTQHHNISPLVGSLNPADYWRELASIPQMHYAGGRDEIMPANIALSYASRFPSNKKPNVIIKDGFDHRHDWHAVPL